MRLDFVLGHNGLRSSVWRLVRSSTNMLVVCTCVCLGRRICRSETRKQSVAEACDVSKSLALVCRNVNHVSDGSRRSSLRFASVLGSIDGSLSELDMI
jgi:hypothetical protein